MLFIFIIILKMYRYLICKNAFDIAVDSQMMKFVYESLWLELLYAESIIVNNNNSNNNIYQTNFVIIKLYMRKISALHYRFAYIM